MYKDLLKQYLIEANNRILKLCGVEFINKYDLMEVDTWSDKFVEKYMLEVIQTGTCPWREFNIEEFLQPNGDDCEKCGYATRHGNCNVKGSNGHSIVDKIGTLGFHNIILRRIAREYNLKAKKIHQNTQKVNKDFCKIFDSLYTRHLEERVEAGFYKGSLGIPYTPKSPTPWNDLLVRFLIEKDEIIAAQTGVYDYLCYSDIREVKTWLEDECKLFFTRLIEHDAHNKYCRWDVIDDAEICVWCHRHAIKFNSYAYITGGMHCMQCEYNMRHGRCNDNTKRSTYQKVIFGIRKALPDGGHIIDIPGIKSLLSKYVGLARDLRDQQTH